MKKLFVVDMDKEFKTQVKSLCQVDQVDVQLFSTAMEIFSLIAKEKPYLILLSLDVPDVNDFVMYDLLKKTGDNSIPVVVTYSNQSLTKLQQYKNMKFQPKEYCQKPISNDDMHRLLQHHLDQDEEDDDEFTDEDIDRLVSGGYLKIDDKDKDDTKELLADTKNDLNGGMAQAEENELEIADILENVEDKTGRPDKELKNQVIALEQQNEFLSSENKELTNASEKLKTEIGRGNAIIQQLKSDLNKSSADQDAKLAQIDTIKNYSQKLENQNTDLTEKLKTLQNEKTELQIRFKELADRLTDKESELVARNDEFEKSLNDKSEKLVQEVEERLMAEFRKKEEQLLRENLELKEKKVQDQSSLQNELENLKQLYQQLQNDRDELKKREESLNRTVSTLAEEKVNLSEKMKIMEEEKVTFSEKVNNLEENLTSQRQEMEEKENTHLSALENLNKELEKVLDRLHFYKNRVNQLAELLQKAQELTQPENVE